MVDIAVPTAVAVQVPEAPPISMRAPAAKRTVSPFGSGKSGNKPVAKPSPPNNSPLEIEFAEMARAWRRYRSTNSRDAVYIYLASVFGIVTRWQRLNCAMAQGTGVFKKLSSTVTGASKLWRFVSK